MENAEPNEFSVLGFLQLYEVERKNKEIKAVERYVSV